MQTTMSDDLTTGEWLEQISHQLYKQNELLATLVDQPDESDTQHYSCELCNQRVAKDNREAHLRQNHNYVDGASVSKRFTEV